MSPLPLVEQAKPVNAVSGGRRIGNVPAQLQRGLRGDDCGKPACGRNIAPDPLEKKKKLVPSLLLSLYSRATVNNAIVDLPLAAQPGLFRLHCSESPLGILLGVLQLPSAPPTALSTVDVAAFYNAQAPTFHHLPRLHFQS